MGPEQAAPAVVAVVVACGHGTWLDEALYSLASQDYPNLSVLVMEVGADEKVADRVGVFVPNAHFARMPPGTTFAQAANKALEMVEGAAHVLVCHDDVALAPDAVRLLLEEAYRSNAGLTCPKFVSWDHPDRLLSVGMGADHLGVVHPLVEPGELDQGQHDAAHEVFVAPSGAVLVRKDLWRALGGFSTAAGAPGEDLDLSWRAHLAGARVVVAPQARARHLEAGAKGLRRDGPAKLTRARSGPSKAGVRATAADGASNKSTSGSDAASNAGPSIGPGPGPDQANGSPNTGMNGVDAVPSSVTNGNGGPSATTNGTHGASPATGQQPETVTAPPGPKSKRTTDEQRLRVLWTCYGPAGLVLVTPVAVLFAFAESFWALLHPRAGRGFLSPLRSLARSFSHPQALWAARRRAQKSRRVSDLAIWKAQSHGSARLRALVRPRLERGHELAWAATRAGGAHEGVKGSEAADGEGPVPLVGGLGIGGTGLARAQEPSTQGPSTQVPSTQRPSTKGPGTQGSGAQGPGPQGPGRQEAGRQGLGGGTRYLASDSWGPADLANGSDPAAGLGQAGEKANWKIGALTAAVVAALLLIGSRNILSGSIPLVGQLPPFNGGVASWWHEWWAGAGPGALASSSFAPPGLFFMALVGAVSFGSVNVAVHLLAVVPLALGPFGVYRATRPFGSQKGRVAATVLYAALPIPYNALSQGHWSGLVGYAAAPWVLSSLSRLAGQAPYPESRWREAWPRFVSLGLLVAVTAALAPATFLVVPIVGVALCVGSVLTGRGGGAKLLAASFIATVIGFVALLPWSLGAFHSYGDFFAPGSGRLGALSVSSVFRLDTGSYGGGVLGWALIAAAAVPLFIGRSWRLAWAARMWIVVIAFLGLAWAGSRGWFPVPALELVLAPAGAALAFSVALGVASVEVDLPGYRFGWRQFAPAFGAVAVVAATLPFLGWVGGGQWDLPQSAAESAYAFPASSLNGDYRVLWVGSPGAIPLAPQGSSDGLAFATSLDGLPTAGELWAPVGAGQAPLVAQDLSWADNRVTTSLGRLLAPLAVRYVVVPVGLGVTGADENQVVAALERQVDLFPVGTDSSYRVFANSSWAPLFSVLPAGTSLPSGRNQWAIAAGLQQLDLASGEALPVNGTSSSSFAVRGHSSPRYLFGSVEDGSWRVLANGHRLASASAAGWASSWDLPAGTNAVVLNQPGTGGQHLADIAMVLVWAIVVVVALVRLRSRWRAELTRTNLELSTSAMDVPEMDWASVWEEETVG